MPQGLVQNNPANDPDKKPVRSRSHFKPNVSVYQTARFGECTPFYGAEVVPDDENFSLRVNSDVDTLTLRSPLMSPLRMNKDYFFVPLRAILPHNAELLVTNPLTGDDVVPEDVNAVISNYDLIGLAGNRLNGNGGILYRWFNQAAKSTYADTDEVLNEIGTFLLAYRASWYLLSAGSVARNLVYNFHDFFQGPKRNGRRLTYDQVVELYSSWFLTQVAQFKVRLVEGIAFPGRPGASVPTLTTKDYIVQPGYEQDNDVNDVISLRQLFYLIEQGAVPVQVSDLVLYNADVTAIPTPLNPDDGVAIEFFNETRLGAFLDRNYVSRVGTTPGSAGFRYYNLSRVVAYQLACIQFYTTDAVDYLYSTALWHENMMTLVRGIYGQGQDFMFYQLNGTQQPYDCVSGRILHQFAIDLGDQITTGITVSNGAWSWNTGNNAVLAAITRLIYLGNLFGYNRSLKFRDYFVGSKKAPMAVGNVNVAVQSGEFSVVDVTKNILRQRFLNQVNRVGRTLKEYSQGIFGAMPMRDPHEVVFLGSTTDIIGAEETQNTGSEQRDQFSMTSRLRSESSKFAFEGSFQEFGVVVGILTFDVARPYSHNSDGALRHVSRFDMFNPFMQNIGDQDVLGSEIFGQQNQENFGYQLRYSEYRQRTDVAAGGFLNFLPGFAFIADYRALSQLGKFTIQVSPDFIRSRSYEFDDIYQALPNYSPAGYFHFIIRHDCDVNINRPMLAAPSIL